MSTAAAAVPAAAGPRIRYYRHSLPVRIMHWINVVCLTILLMSGLGIFNAHPALYWGKSSYTGQPPVLEIGSIARPVADPAVVMPGLGAPVERRGVLRVFGHQFDTTGLLGLRRHDGIPDTRAFPGWATIPGHYSLADARLWHFFFAWLLVINGIAYVLYGIASGHFRHDMATSGTELRGIGQSVRDHLRLRHPAGEAARHYNVLQKLAYLAVIFILLPLIILMGMAMSPMLDSAIAGWVDWFGGRQSARTIHFIVAWLLVAFVLIHVFEVIVSGVWNHLRSMITGYYAIDRDAETGSRHE